MINSNVPDLFYQKNKKMYEYYSRGGVDQTTQVKRDYEGYINACRVYG